MPSRYVSMRIMPLKLGDRVVYPIGEALSRAGLSRATYFRWVRSGRISDTRFKDRNGRRVFTEDELARLTKLVDRLVSEPEQLNILAAEDQHGH